MRRATERVLFRSKPAVATLYESERRFAASDFNYVRRIKSNDACVMHFV
jgi:hypothetical protein